MVKELRTVFEIKGPVVDIFISKKARNNRKDFFGFVRFSNEWVADRAVQRFNGYILSGAKIWVSYAKYQKGGAPFSFKPVMRKNLHACRRPTTSPAYRNSRKHRDVVLRKNRRDPAPAVEKYPTSLNVDEVTDVTKKITNAAVVENNDVSSNKEDAASTTRTEVVGLEDITGESKQGGLLENE